MLLLILAVLAVIFITEIVLTEMEQWGWATALLLATLVCCHFFSPFSPVAFVKAHGIFTLVYVGAYVGVGIVWSFLKWFSFLRGFRDSFREQREAFLKFRGLPAGTNVPEEHIKAFKEYLENHTNWSSDRGLTDGIRNLERPRAAKNKSRITAWMAYWPCSLIGTFLNDPVRRLFNWAFNQFKALYQQLADYVFRNDGELK